ILRQASRNKRIRVTLPPRPPGAHFYAYGARFSQQHEVEPVNVEIPGEGKRSHWRLDVDVASHQIVRAMWHATIVTADGSQRGGNGQLQHFEYNILVDARLFQIEQAPVSKLHKRVSRRMG